MRRWCRDFRTLQKLRWTPIQSEKKIHALKLDKSWRGTAPKFLQHYESQILLLESITDDRALLWPERTKMIMLESAVKSNKDLAALMAVERLDIAKGWAPMTFPQYVSILKSRAHELDACLLYTSDAADE